MSAVLLPLLTAGVGATIVAVMSLVTTALNQRHQRQLEQDRASDARRLEAMKAALAIGSRAAEKRATIAADVLLAAFDLLDAIKAATSVAMLQSDPPEVPGETTKERLRKMVVARAVGVDKYHRRFLKRYVLAEVYLPSGTTEILDRIRQLEWSIQVDQRMHAETVGDTHGDDAFYRQGFGNVPKKQLDEIRAELKRLLLPHAQEVALLAEAAAAKGLPAAEGAEAALLKATVG